jgi:single-strand DNA-binding protein
MFHEITIIGHLGREPEMRYTPSGQAVTNFSLAANRRYTNGNGEQVKETIWFRVAAWGRLAETCNQYLSIALHKFVPGYRCECNTLSSWATSKKFRNGFSPNCT